VWLRLSRIYAEGEVAKRWFRAEEGARRTKTGRFQPRGVEDSDGQAIGVKGFRIGLHRECTDFHSYVAIIGSHQEDDKPEPFQGSLPVVDELFVHPISR
jgi:hypothetical protein